MPHLNRISLREIVTLFLILIILTVVLFPLGYPPHIQPRYNSCMSNVKQIGAAVITYAQDYDGQYLGATDSRLELTHGRPMTTAEHVTDNHAHDWITQLYPYTKNPAVFYCPSDPPEDSCTRHFNPTEDEPCRTSYTLNGWTAFGLKNAEVASPAVFVLMGERNSRELRPTDAYEFAWWKWQQDGEHFVWPPKPLPIPAKRAAHDLALSRHYGQSNYLFGDGHAKSKGFSAIWSAATPTAFWPQATAY